jgi:hypothetical protein
LDFLTGIYFVFPVARLLINNFDANQIADRAKDYKIR